MSDRPFILKPGMKELEKKFHKEIKNGIGPQMLKEQEIRSSSDFLSVDAAHIDPCLTDEQKRKASSGQRLSVFGLNECGKKWKLRLGEVNGTYFFSEETRYEMIVANGWETGTPICIWGAPGGIFRDGKVRFLFTEGS